MFHGAIWVPSPNWVQTGGYSLGWYLLFWVYTMGSSHDHLGPGCCGQVQGLQACCYTAVLLEEEHLVFFHDPSKRGIRGELTRVAHSILILTGGCETFPSLEVCCVLTSLEVCCVPPWGTLADEQIVWGWYYTSRELCPYEPLLRIYCTLCACSPGGLQILR